MKLEKLEEERELIFDALKKFNGIDFSEYSESLCLLEMYLLRLKKFRNKNNLEDANLRAILKEVKAFYKTLERHEENLKKLLFVEYKKRESLDREISRLEEAEK